MKRLISYCFVLTVFLALASCGEKKSIYSGFQKMDSGAYMKFYTTNAEGQQPRLNDEVTFQMAQYFKDSLLFNTANEEEPMQLILTKPDFVGDVSDALLAMHVGDSARLVVSVDSVFLVSMGTNNVPEEFAGRPIYYDLKLLSIKPFEQIAAEHKALMDSLMQAEGDFLVPLRNDPKNTITESGLIIMEKTGKGKKAEMGDYLNYDFTLCTPSGDTIMNSFGVEAMEMQYGEEVFGRGFNEALGMLPEGGTMRCVIPSFLAFDSVGYQTYIQPYTPLVVKMRMNSVMDKDAYEKHQAELKAQKEAERERRLALEKDMIADYILTHGITETPTESGLYIIRQQEGEGDLAKWGDKVSVHYILSTLKGDEVESSYTVNQPISFTLGGNQMIPAIEEALMTMAPGAKVTLVTPSELAFGEFVIDEEVLPAYSPLVIELELVEIK